LRTALVGLLAVGLGGCLPPPTNAVSPPAEVLAGPLLGKQWQLETITVDGEPVAFGAIAPVTASFSTTGGLELRTERCWAGGFKVLYRADGSYSLYDSAFTAQLCPPAAYSDDVESLCRGLLGDGWTPAACEAEVGRQNGAPTNALRATSRYAVEGDRLRLWGDAVEMTFSLQPPP
jgi:hypothetical protein